MHNTTGATFPENTPLTKNPENVTQEIRLVTSIPGPRSRQLHLRREAVVSTGVATVLPVYIEKASGAFLRDVDGNQFLDFGAGIGVTTIGHAPQRVAEAVSAQAHSLLHTLFTITPYEGYVRVAELLSEHTPGTHAKKTVLVNSGAEAVENGVKIARKFTGKRGVAVLDHAYHGRTNLTMAMNYKAAPYATGFGPLAGDVYHAPNSYPLRDGLSGEQAAARTISYLEKVVGSADLACLVVEPIQGEGGFIVPAEGFLTRLQEWCTNNSVVFIADEIQSGIARTGAYFASEHSGLIPDLILSAKGIAAGLPLAAVTGRANMMDAAQAGGLGGTFGGNPVACAAAVAVFETIAEDGLLEAATEIGKKLVTGLNSLKEKFPQILEVRGIGAMVAIEFGISPLDDQLTGSDTTQGIIRYAAERGLLFLSAGTDGNVLRFLPSLVVTNEHIELALTIIEEALEVNSTKGKSS